MRLEAIKLELIEWLAKLEDNDTINYLKIMKDSKTSKNDWWDDLTEVQKQGAERGLKDIEEGRVVSHEDVKRKKYKYWICDKIILLTILLFFFIDSSGQDNSNDKILRNEIGINFFTYLPSPKYKHFPYEKQFHYSIVNGINYKRYFDNNVIKISINYRQVNETQDYPEYWISERTYQEGTLRIGYSKQMPLFKQKTIIPYFGSELIAKIASFEGTEGGGFTGAIVTYQSEDRGIGLSPVVGFQINIAERISVNLETTYDLLRIHNEVKEIQNRIGILISETTTTETDYKFIFNPLCSCIFSFRF
jgi:hypothetical protein